MSLKNKFKPVVNRNYLARDFEGFRSKLLGHARMYFSDNIQDFSEAGLGGLFLDMVSFVGDNMSFYLDHQFTELNALTAVETKNIQKHLDSAGVKVRGGAPSTVKITFYLEIPAQQIDNQYVPQRNLLPIIAEGAKLVSDDGIPFTLVEDLDFRETKKDGSLIANSVVTVTANNIPTTFVVSREALCISGQYKTETFKIPDSSLPFRKITLAEENITAVYDVSDLDANSYYEVDYLSQDTVFLSAANVSPDSETIKRSLAITPAPYRYLRKYNYNTRLTTIQFGSGDATTLDNDILPDPADLGLPLYGKTTFSRFNIDPNALLQTQTLGISPRNTTITVKYRYGGGADHNVPAQTIKTVDTISFSFPSSPSAEEANKVRASVDVNNFLKAMGGGDAPTLGELKRQIPSARTAQSRIVSKEDLVSRIYTLPNQFGKIFRVGIRDNPINPLAAQIFLIGSDQNGKLEMTPDTLKRSLRVYLNQFRLISDAMDVLDARIINYGISIEVISIPGSNKTQVAQSCIANLDRELDIDNFQIDQPIALSPLVSTLLDTDGVMSLIKLEVFNLNGVKEDRSYSSNSFNVEANTFNDMVVGPAGSIFELKYPEVDIKVTVR